MELVPILERVLGKDAITGAEAAFVSDGIKAVLIAAGYMPVAVAAWDSALGNGADHHDSGITLSWFTQSDFEPVGDGWRSSGSRVVRKSGSVKWSRATIELVIELAQA